MRGLLDVDVLIAALDANHVQHASTRAWLTREGSHGWASCPLTQNGSVRILSQPGYPSPLRTSEVIERLRAATAHASHDFWGDDISLLDDRHIEGGRVLGPRQVTDLYLLALAVHRGGRLVTFDERIPLSVVRGARSEHLAIVR